MAKYFFILAMIALTFVIFQPQKKWLTGPSSAPSPQSSPIIRDLPPMDEMAIKEQVKELPIEEEQNSTEEEKTKKPTKKKGLASLKLTGTIYGVEQPSAMLVDRKGTSFVVKLGEKILRSNYKIVRVEKDHIIVERRGKYFQLKMSKNNVSR